MQNYIKKGKQENKQMELFKFKLINKIILNVCRSQIIKRVIARKA